MSKWLQKSYQQQLCCAVSIYHSTGPLEREKAHSDANLSCSLSRFIAAVAVLCNYIKYRYQKAQLCRLSPCVTSLKRLPKDVANSYHMRVN